MAGDSQALSTLSERLNHLFVTVHPKDRGPYSNEEVAAAIRERGGAISGAYIWQLRTGKKDNPTLKHLEALAGFFGVPPAYFFDDATAMKVGADLETLKLLQDVNARKIGLRTIGLSGRSQQQIGEMVARIRELEGLENGEAEADPS